jgi:hypothetical protein
MAPRSPANSMARIATQPFVRVFLRARREWKAVKAWKVGETFAAFTAFIRARSLNLESVEPTDRVDHRL